MDYAVFSAFAKELEKLSASEAMQALDTAGQLSSNVPGFGSPLKKVTPVPRAGSFKISGYDGPAVSDASSVTATEEYPRKKRAGEEIEKMDAPSWKQTAKDLPVVILGTGVSYGVGKTIGEEVAKRYGKNPSIAKHAPLAHAIASSIGGYAMGRARAGLKRRREEARERAKK